MRCALVCVSIIFLLAGCGNNLIERQINGDSICKEEAPDGDTVIILYPKSDDAWNGCGYYENGNIYKQWHIIRIDSDEVMDLVWRYEDGSVWKYKAYLNGNLFYYRDYDLNDSVVRSNGFEILGVDSINEVIFTQDGIFKRAFISVQPPDCKVSMMVCDENPDSDTLDDIEDNCMIWDFVDHDGFYEVEITGDSLFQMRIYWLIEDTITGQTEKGDFIDIWKYDTAFSAIK